MKTKNQREQMELALRRGTLIEKRLVKLQLGFLLSGMRAPILAYSHWLPRRLSGKNEHEMTTILREEFYKLLNDLANWPSRAVPAGRSRRSMPI
ncbi:MAG TPA: hypothetical protein VIT23_10735 [Terrimicrobiaceae bacterium]